MQAFQDVIRFIQGTYVLGLHLRCQLKHYAAVQMFQDALRLNGGDNFLSYVLYMVSKTINLVVQAFLDVFKFIGGLIF